MSIKGIGRPRTPGFEVGDTFAKSAVIAVDQRMGIDGYMDELYWCKCECGNTWARTKQLIRDNPDAACRSCTMRASRAARGGEHPTKHPLYRVWLNMLDRCNNPHAQAYDNYGGRGITVCRRWYKMENFIADMGDKPEGRTLERRKNNKGYSPANCYWATPSEQNRNTRKTRFINYKGKKMKMIDAAEQFGINENALRLRIDVHGWSVHDALTIPLRVTKRVRRAFLGA